MTPEQRQEIIRLLEKGEELSPEWARILFPPEKREYELVYHGKEREEDILANTLAVPLQPVRTFGSNGDWSNMLIFGDNLQVMKSLLEMKKAGRLCNADGTPGVRLIYIDPPFATKQEFRGSQDQKAYQDKIAGAQFLEFLRKRLVFLRELLSDDGSIYVHLDCKKIHYVKILLLDELLSEQNFRNEIVIRRTQKNYLEGDSIKSLNVGNDSLLIYAKTYDTQFKPVFRQEKRMEPWHAFDAPNWSGTRPNLIYELFGHMPPPNRCWVWVKEKANKAIKEGKLRPNPNTGKPEYLIPARDKVLCTNLWDDLNAYSFSSGYPTEKNETLLHRVVEMASNKGDIIFDCFAGSGTTLAVAEKLGRGWIGVDCGKLAIYTMQKRLLNISESKDLENPNKKYNKHCKPFTLYNAGLYDFSRLKELSWDSWRFFALQLFQCRDEPHTIGGIKLGGYLKGASVLVFNHMKEKGVRIDEETIESLHEALGTRIGNRLFIIAPALTFDFQQDYITLGNVRYYALRIPYSIINELHQREFTCLKQPSDEMAVNDTVEAVGFDFIRTPELKFECGIRKGKGDTQDTAYIKIKTFKSEAVVREPMRKKGNLETFSMVMLDYDFDDNSQVFDLDAVFYADALEKDGWALNFPIDSTGKKIMAVFIDIYGNEARIVIEPEQFGISSPKKKKGK
ncbi:MAG: site-specific DNA-methyltransferase [Candidatus Brocadia sp. WS118]|nr:MAG: site-specific DNA-methyltransferase [Candidatus Brocadia sp. WS118]